MRLFLAASAPAPVWSRTSKLNIAPDAAAYCTLIRVERPVKADALFADFAELSADAATSVSLQPSHFDSDPHGPPLSAGSIQRAGLRNRNRQFCHRHFRFGARRIKMRWRAAAGSESDARWRRCKQAGKKCTLRVPCH